MFAIAILDLVAFNSRCFGHAANLQASGPHVNPTSSSEMLVPCSIMWPVTSRGMAIQVNILLPFHNVALTVISNEKPCSVSN